MKPLSLIALAAALALSSCAYMQTHKNVSEMGSTYKGYQLHQPRQLYQSGGQWYVAAVPAEYRMSHDLVHDNIFRKTNEPTLKLVRAESSPAYHSISPSTAAVLLQENGYMDAATLAQEIHESHAPWLPSLPHATPHPVRAQFAGEPSAPVTSTRTPEQTPLVWKTLSGLDFVVVDIPGTVVYNVAVPFIAPFVFFYEFLSEQNQ